MCQSALSPCNQQWHNVQHTPGTQGLLLSRCTSMLPAATGWCKAVCWLASAWPGKLAMTVIFQCCLNQMCSLVVVLTGMSAGHNHLAHACSTAGAPMQHELPVALSIS